MSGPRIRPIQRIGTLNEKYAISLPTQAPRHKDDVKKVPYSASMSITQNQGCVIAGDSGSGKTNLLKALLEYGLATGSWNVVFILCNTLEGRNRDYDFFPLEKFKYDNVDESHITMIMDYAKQFNYTKNIVVVLDDVVGNKKLCRGDAVEKLFTRAPHYGITPIVLTQHINRLSNVVRSQSQELFIANMDDANYRAAATFLRGIRDRDGIALMQRYCSKKYQFMRFNKGVNQYGSYWIVPDVGVRNPVISFGPPQ